MYISLNNANKEAYALSMQLTSRVDTAKRAKRCLRRSEEIELLARHGFAAALTLLHSAKGGAVGGGAQWMGVVFYSKQVVNCMQITTPCFHYTPL